MITTAPDYVKHIRRNLQGYSYKGIARWRLRDRSDRCDIIIKRLLIKYDSSKLIGTREVNKDSIWQDLDWELYPKGLERPDLKQ